MDDYFREFTTRNFYETQCRTMDKFHEANEFKKQFLAQIYLKYITVLSRPSFYIVNKATWNSHLMLRATEGCEKLF